MLKERYHVCFKVASLRARLAPILLSFRPVSPSNPVLLVSPPPPPYSYPRGNSLTKRKLKGPVCTVTPNLANAPLGFERGNCFPVAYVKPLCLVCKISIKDWGDVHSPSKVIWRGCIHQQTPVLNIMKPCEQCGSLRLTQTISNVSPFASFSLSHELCVEDNCVPIFSRLSFSNTLFCCGFRVLKTLVSGRLWRARLFACPTNVSPVKQVLNQSDIKSNTWSPPCTEQPTDWRWSRNKAIGDSFSCAS